MLCCEVKKVKKSSIPKTISFLSYIPDDFFASKTQTKEFNRYLSI